VNSSVKSNQQVQHPSPCVGCGYCCIKIPCSAAVRLYGSNITECPQLKWDENMSRYFCGLMTIPGPIGDEYRKELYAGEGCCCSLNSWRNDVQRRTGVPNEFAPLPSLMQKFIACMAKEFISSDAVAMMLSRLCCELEKDGYCKEEIKHIYNNVVRIFDDNRSGFSRGFIG